MNYVIVVEHEGDAWGAYAPDLPGCGVAGESRERVLELIKEAIPFHIDGLRRNGDPVPEPSAEALTIAV